ncbi:LOB domain-containing protein 1-like [Papaver somniferum]|uniref:LOB domain-containing protein 1-like n=1 Tax=Papaver somniferum TaxID=3469 RepID=UPI000E704A00|nr:LOB domain-containing protein 1-like [Papaver somniferum]
MGSSTDTSIATNIHTQSPAPSLSQVVLTPCAACKILRRRCGEKCVLAPYFPPTEPLKFTTAHRVFGASNIIKMLQELPESQRVDAVSSMVYEAYSRVKDPVYGCAGTIYQLQKQVIDLQVQLAKSQAEVISMQCQQAQFVDPLCMEMKQHSRYQQQQQQPTATTISLASSLSSLRLQQDIDDFMMSNAITTQYQQQQQQPTTSTIFPTSSSLSSLEQEYIDDFLSNNIITQSSSLDNNFDGLIFGHANMGLEWNHPYEHYLLI